ncbi:hypothetical protein [Laspinema sp. D2d]|uniref:hypothetical protein n=1 Tax=Laspinema sp. D2d TaxID=2953686 RepID=UPI0021BA3CD6|nr:hypothetical protein [Laspinema sp. D2d]
MEVRTTAATQETDAIASVKPHPSFPPTAWVPPVRSLGYSLAAGVLFIAIAWLWIKRKDQ